MGQRTSGRALLLLACLLLAGCASTGRAHRESPARSTRASQSAAQACARAARLTPGVAFPGWHMGAVQFLSVTSGVGITAESFPCFRRIKGGAQVGVQRQPVRLAVTSDGGRSWHVAGSTIAIGPVRNGVVPEEIAALSPVDLLALVGRGRVMGTHDGGADWQVQAVPNPVVEIARERGVVWAVSCPGPVGRTFPYECRPELWRSRSATGAWTRVALPRVTAQDGFAVHFAATQEDVMIALTEASDPPTGELLSSSDAGLHWTRRRAPTWDGNNCGEDDLLTAHAPHTFWLVCLGGAAAGSSTKGLLRSADAGRRWTTVSAVTSLVRPPSPRSVPLGEPSALAAGSPTRLWLSLFNGLAESNDGGRLWTYRRGLNPGGWATAVDGFDADHAWLLASGVGLWRTMDGLAWSAVGAQNTG